MNPVDSVPLELAGDTVPIPAGFAQRQYLSALRRHPGTPDVRLCTAFRLTGPLDVPALVRAVRLLIGRHEALRSVPGEAGDESFLACASSSPDRPVRLIRAQAPSPRHFDQYVRLRLAAMLTEGSQPGRWRPVQSVLVRAEEGAHVLVLTVSHLVVDGVGLQMLTRELWELYRGLLGGVDVEARLGAAPSVRSQVRLERELALASRIRTESYWTHRLRDCPVNPWPNPWPDDERRDVAGGGTARSLPVQTFQAIARGHRSSEFVVALAAFAAELIQRTRRDRMVIQVPIDLRGPEARGAVGMFSMQLPVVVDRDWFSGSGNAVFAVRRAVLDAVEYRYVHPEVLTSARQAADQGGRRALSVLATHLDHRAPAGDAGTEGGVRIETFGPLPVTKGYSAGLLLNVIQETDRTVLLLEYGRMARHDAESFMDSVLRRVSSGDFRVGAAAEATRNPEPAHDHP